MTNFKSIFNITVTHVSFNLRHKLIVIQFEVRGLSTHSTSKMASDYALSLKLELTQVKINLNFKVPVLNYLIYEFIVALAI